MPGAPGSAPERLLVQSVPAGCCLTTRFADRARSPRPGRSRRPQPRQTLTTAPTTKDDNATSRRLLKQSVRSYPPRGAAGKISVPRSRGPSTEIFPVIRHRGSGTGSHRPVPLVRRRVHTEGTTANVRRLPAPARVHRPAAPGPRRTSFPPHQGEPRGRRSAEPLLSARRPGRPLGHRPRARYPCRYRMGVVGVSLPELGQRPLRLAARSPRPGGHQPRARHSGAPVDRIRSLMAGVVRVRVFSQARTGVGAPEQPRCVRGVCS